VNTPRSDKDRLELMKLTVFLLPSDEKVRVEVSAVDLQVFAVRLNVTAVTLKVSVVWSDKLGAGFLWERVGKVVGSVWSSGGVVRKQGRGSCRFGGSGDEQINNDDFHTCMFACFLSQEEPKMVHQDLKDSSWIEAMQEELLQFKMQKDIYVAEILKKFGLTDGKLASTPIDTEKPLLKDPDGEDRDVHTYRSMIGSLMYLTLSRPDITFAVYACAHF
nr:hypothetical protein [Tanacetum cinerariifolium]